MFPCGNALELGRAELCVALFAPLWSFFTENCENANSRDRGEPCWGWRWHRRAKIELQTVVQLQFSDAITKKKKDLNSHQVSLHLLGRCQTSVSDRALTIHVGCILPSHKFNVCIFVTLPAFWLIQINQRTSICFLSRVFTVCYHTFPFWS